MQGSIALRRAAGAQLPQKREAGSIFKNLQKPGIKNAPLSDPQGVGLRLEEARQPWCARLRGMTLPREALAALRANYWLHYTVGWYGSIQAAARCDWSGDRNLPTS